ncbi:short chain dehydrogenase reductase family [Neofusicoccum parvum]|nr:short chain dehydrogenase reductase family [Neofusicoccum parvum]
MPSDREEERVRLLGDCHARGEHQQEKYQPANALYDPAPNRSRTFVLCFDGTGNKFCGTDSDSNILKIFRMLDRRDGSQFHYYQPGIGTYVTTGSLSHTSHWQRFKSWYVKTKDSAVGTSFAEHVMGGYKFLMRYYLPGDEIYFFGFSRGAYIARFLAEMLDHVGLLTAGNEEMARFAWKTFQKWQTRQERTEKEKDEKRRLRDYMCAFRETFSRPVRRIRFLGLFDTVNSVPAFEGPWMQRSKFPYTARSTSKVIRHAVAIDERRAKFRQDLISEVKTHKKKKHHHLRYKHYGGAKSQAADTNGNMESDTEPGQERINQFGRKLEAPRAFRDSSETSGLRSLSPGLSPRRGGRRRRSNVSSVSLASSSAVKHTTPYDSDEDEQDIQEVWFAGCHADIGGGWSLEEGEESPLSHVPLVWMVREAQRAGLRFDENKIHALNCCPEEEEFSDLLTAHAGNDAEQQDARAPAAIAPPEIQISAATPPLDNRSRSYLNTAPQNGTSPPLQNGGQAAATTTTTDPDPAPSSRFHALLHSSATAGRIHDVLCFNNGASHFSVLSWNAMEWIPFRRMDLTPDGSWRSIAWPLPKGEVRDVPAGVVVHHTVLRRMRHDEGYRPGNLIVGGGGRGVRRAPKEAGMGQWKVLREEGDPVGEVWVRA